MARAVFTMICRLAGRKRDNARLADFTQLFLVHLVPWPNGV